MKNIYNCLFIAFVQILPILIIAQVPVIQSVVSVSNTIEQYSKFEAKINVNASFINPYDYDEIRVTAVFTAPNGEQITVEGFYMEGFQIANTNTGTLSALPSANGFYLRFSPRQTGNWSYNVACTNASGTGTFATQQFACVAVNAPQNNGFVQMSGSNYFKFDNGTQYIPIGQNIAWQSSNPYTDYKKWISKMSDADGNFMRLWLCHWGLGIEWKNNSSGFAGLKKYKQSNAFYLDWLMDYCAEKGVYTMFCINHHGQVSSQVNPNWSENPYNAVNGGPCQNTWDFFTNTQAKALHKNRLRYILARWGAQRSIMTWELFNEVNWTDNFTQNKSNIVDWHAEMAAFLKQNDYLNRPVSTSFGSPDTEDDALWNNPDMDYTQRHYYFDSPNLERILAAGVRENLQKYDKPVFIGEYGLGADGSGLSALDPNGIHIHNNMWGPLFGGSTGTGMNWWWDNYFDPRNLYYHFTGVASVAKEVAFDEKNYRPTISAFVSGAPGDLNIGTSLGWGGLGDTLIQISSTGGVFPSSPKLGQFLYGSTWNTQFRRPPVFKVNMPEAGKFTILTGSQMGNSPKLYVVLDGVEVLNIIPAANQSYAINVPQGLHTLKVDNIGIDWMNISNYAFSGIGSVVDAYALKSADNKHLAVWLLNSNYNHINVKANGVPNAITNAMLEIDNIESGNYQAKWYNCQTGDLATSTAFTVNGGVLKLPLPELVWDLALLVEPIPVGTFVVEEAAVTLEVSPNPVSAGSANLSFELEQQENIQILLYNAEGALVQSLYTGNLEAGIQNMALSVPFELANGVYWIHLKSAHKTAVKPIAVVR
ncbi:MAG: hypothetical protein RIR11_2876 [Bacteroidota bacterium]|jgi:hypothetical protein